MKKCVICGKKHNCREYTCSDECHELFKQKLIKEFGEHKIIVDLTTGNEHRVPIADIIENGVKQEDLKNYPIVGINRLARRSIKARELKQKGEKVKCGNCGYKSDGHTCVTDEKAEFRDGDISICLNCGEVHQRRNGVLELIDIRDLPKDIQGLILKTNVARETVMQRNRNRMELKK